MAIWIIKCTKKRKRFRLEEGLNFLKHRNFPPCLFSGLVIFASTRHNPHPNSAANAADCGISILCVKVWGGKFLCGCAIYFLFAAKASDKSAVQLSLLLSLALLRGERKKDPGGVLNRVAPRRPAGPGGSIWKSYSIMESWADAPNRVAKPTSPACSRFYSPLYNAFQFYWATDSNLIATLMRAAAANNAFSFYYHALRVRLSISYFFSKGFVCAVSQFAPGP
jgi:hypothetical protein